MQKRRIMGIEQNKRPSLLQLFFTFAKIGAVTFGGGYAMLPIIQREIVEKHQWCTDEEILDYYAVGQCTPGAIAINTSTFIGYKTKGRIGGIIATLGMVLPSLIIISLIYNILNIFQSNIYVQNALAGIQISVAALITASLIKLSKKSIVDLPTALVALISFLAITLFNISPMWIVFFGIAFGIISNKLKKGKSI